LLNLLYLAKFKDINVKKGTFDSIDVIGLSTFKGNLNGATGNFSGDLTAGTLKATEIVIDAPVTAGETYLIRRDNRQVQWSSIYLNSDTPHKEITTPAKGTVKLLLKFGNVGSGGQYRISIFNGINETYVVNWTAPTSNSSIIHNINLSDDISTICLYLGTTGSGGITNDKFEVRCENIPKSLRLLG
jgi:hypothetical protein